MKYTIINQNKNNTKFNCTRKQKIKGGDIKYILSEINHSWNQSYNKMFPQDKRDPYNGEFVVHKEFKVESPVQAEIYGYVIQKVQKSTNAYTIIDDNKEEIIDIEKFTDGNVKYMNDTYYELFFIINGESTDGDNFQNGAILEYTYDHNNNSFRPDDKTNTEGGIIIKGTSWFISADKNEVIDNYNYYINGNINGKMNVNNINNTNNNGNKKILGINWSLDNNTPANGLPYSPRISSKANIAKRESNILEHNVKVTWDTTKKKRGKSYSETSSIINKLA
jgi:hypothetical protein